MVALFSLLASALAGISSVAKAAPIATPYWEINYDISASYMEIDSPLLGQVTVQLGPGTMQLQIQDFSAGAEARLSAFDLMEVFDAFGILHDLDVSMEGDANGTMTGPQTLAWSTPADGWHTQGTVICNAGALICGVAGLPIGIPVPIDTIGDEPVGDVVFGGANGASPLMSWVLPPDASGLTKTLYVVGAEIDRVWVPVPEPSTALLLGLGVSGLALRRPRAA